jgi:hypothetical protein
VSYLLVLLIPQGSPPLGSKLHGSKGDYTFYPLPNDGPVWTLDVQIWKACSPGGVELIERFAPEVDEAISSLENLEKGTTVLTGVVEQESFHSVGGEQAVALPKFEEWLSRVRVVETKTLGFDVLDATGLSALTNVGLLPSELKALGDYNLAATEFGLLFDAASARRFAEFANIAAVEHAPFIAVRVVSLETA